MKNIIVIHHSADSDGIFCREIARKFFGDKADYIGWDYGDPLPVLPKATEHGVPGCELYMLDISVDGLMDYPGLVWIDHHKSAMEKFGGTAAGLRIDGVAACRLAWQWFFEMGPPNARKDFPNKRQFVDREVFEPLAVRLAGEYDIWDKRDPRVDVFQHGLRAQELSENLWSLLLAPPEPTTLDGKSGVGEIAVEALLDAGGAIQYSTTQANASLAKEVAFDLEWEGLKFLALNKPRANSMTFLAGLRPDHDACLSFYWMKNKWRISLYGAPLKPALDLSPIAVKFGGGGHRQACGFETKTLPFPL